jgi:vacuolar protein sorting-associated protein 13A/C
LRHDGDTSDFEEKGGARNDIQEVYASQTQGKAKQVFDVGDEGLFFLPMLEKTGITVALEQICVPHPKYPTTRVAFRLESLGFQFSPARYHRIMQVVEVFAGSSDEDATDSAFRPWDSPDFDGQLSVLSWKGVGHREAKWEDRYGALAGPFLYLLESESSRSYKTYHSLIGKKLVNVPRESLGDVENVIAICDAGQLDNKVAESAGALLLRFVDEDARNNWQGRFAGAIYRASSPVAVAGLLSVKDENNHTQEDNSESTNAGHAKLAEQETIFLTGILDELKIVISNSRDIDHTSPKLLLAPENPLLELRAIGTKLEFVKRKNDLLVGAVLQTLEIEDKFHGDVSHSCRYLVRSFVKHESEVKEERNLVTGGSKGETKQLRDGSGNKSSKTGPSKPKLTQQRSSGDELFFRC